MEGVAVGPLDKGASDGEKVGIVVGSFVNGAAVGSEITGAMEGMSVG